MSKTDEDFEAVYTVPENSFVAKIKPRVLKLINNGCRLVLQIKRRIDEENRLEAEERNEAAEKVDYAHVNTAIEQLLIDGKIFSHETPLQTEYFTPETWEKYQLEKKTSISLPESERKRIEAEINERNKTMPNLNVNQINGKGVKTDDFYRNNIVSAVEKGNHLGWKIAAFTLIRADKCENLLGELVIDGVLKTREVADKIIYLTPEQFANFEGKNLCLVGNGKLAAAEDVNSPKKPGAPVPAKPAAAAAASSGKLVLNEENVRQLASEGKSQTQIAKILGIPYPTLVSSFARNNGKLRQAFHEGLDVAVQNGVASRILEAAFRRAQNKLPKKPRIPPGKNAPKTDSTIESAATIEKPKEATAEATAAAEAAVEAATPALTPENTGKNETEHSQADGDIHFVGHVYIGSAKIAARIPAEQESETVVVEAAHLKKVIDRIGETDHLLKRIKLEFDYEALYGERTPQFQSVMSDLERSVRR